MAESSAPRARKRGQSLSCPRCDELAREVAVLRQRCDETLRELASARERSNALYLSFPPESLFAEQLPTATAPTYDDLPLRYRIADKVNAAVKAIPVVHGAGKLAAGSLFGALKKLMRR